MANLVIKHETGATLVTSCYIVELKFPLLKISGTTLVGPISLLCDHSKKKN
jgi:hypothetical protein